MDFVNGMANNLLASVVFVLLGFVGRGLFDQIRRRRELDHVHMLLGKGPRPKIVVVFPSSKVSPPPTAPENVLWMSLPEGAAIARVGQVCREAKGRTEVQLIHPGELRTKDGSFVLFGGPESNDWSKEWIARSFPGLTFEPEHHRVRNGPSSWHSQIADGRVQTDVGFLVLGRTDNQSPFVMLWGSSELGTNIAARAYGELRSLLAKDKMRAVLTGKSVLVVVQGDIEGYGVKTSDVSNVRVLFELEGRSLSFQTAGESK